MADHEFMTTEEVADLLRTQHETVRYWRHVGKGPKSFKVGRRVLYAREDVEAFISAARAKPGGVQVSDYELPPGEHDAWGKGVVVPRVDGLE